MKGIHNINLSIDAEDTQGALRMQVLVRNRLKLSNCERDIWSKGLLHIVFFRFICAFKSLKQTKMTKCLQVVRVVRCESFQPLSMM